VPAVPAILTLALSPPCPACLPQVVSQEQVITFEYQGTNFLLTVASVLVAGATGAGGGAPRGMLAPATAFVFEVAAGAPRGRQLPACLQACGCEVAVVQGCACVSLWVSSTFVRCSEVALMLGQSFTMMCSLSSCPGGLLTTEPLPQPRPVAADPQTSWQLPPSCTHTRTLCEKTGSSAGLRAARAGAGAGLAIKGQRGGATPQLFKHKEVNFERLGIGGLDAQFEAIFRRAFASRVFPPSVVERLGIRHVKGVLLHGPPGTGADPAHCAVPPHWPCRSLCLTASMPRHAVTSDACCSTLVAPASPMAG